MIVDVNLIGLSDEEILAAIKSDPSVLSLEQLLYAATLTNDPNEMLKYYQLAAEKNPSASAHGTTSAGHISRWARLMMQ